MLNDRQIATLYRQIADAGDAIDAQTSLLDALVLTIFPEHLSAVMKRQIDQVAHARGSDFAHAKAEWLAICTVETKRQRSSAQYRLEAAMDKLARNGVPYSRKHMDPRLQKSLEAEHALKTLLIDVHYGEINDRRLGKIEASALSEYSHYELNLAIAGLRSRLRHIERRIGLPITPGLFDGALIAHQ